MEAAGELDSENDALQAQVAEAHQSALQERDRELADLRGQLAAVLAPALTALHGKAEEPTGHT